MGLIYACILLTLSFSMELSNLFLFDLFVLRRCTSWICKISIYKTLLCTRRDTIRLNTGRWLPMISNLFFEKNVKWWAILSGLNQTFSFSGYINASPNINLKNPLQMFLCTPQVTIRLTTSWDLLSMQSNFVFLIYTFITVQIVRFR